MYHWPSPFLALVVDADALRGEREIERKRRQIRPPSGHEDSADDVTKSLPRPPDQTLTSPFQ